MDVEKTTEINTPGNHAQGVALSGHSLNIPATVVMPTSTPSIKWRNVQRLGGRVILHGQDFDAAKTECLRLAERDGLTFVPPFDNPYIIAGQGTIGMELCRQVKDVDELDGVFASVGGGGLVAGVASYVKRVAKPTVGVWGVETVDGDAMDRSLKKGKRVVLDEVGPFADGTAVRIVGEEPFRVCKELLDGVVLVNNDEICAAIKDVFEGMSVDRTVVITPELISRRNSICSRTIWCPGSGWPQSSHHPKQIARPEQALCRRHLWREHQLWATAVCRGTSRIGRKKRGLDEHPSPGNAWQVSLVNIIIEDPCS